MTARTGRAANAVRSRHPLYRWPVLLVTAAIGGVYALAYLLTRKPTHG